MKRILSVLSALLIAVMLFPAVNAAHDGLYCEYTPKSERSALFYIDIYSDKEISAAVAELSFDSDIAEFRSVTSDDPEDSVRSNLEGTTVRFAFASKKARSGLICRAGFKALREGSCAFTLKVSSAADGEPALLRSSEPYTLTVSVGKEDVTASSKSTSSSSRSSSGTSSRGGRLSDISGAEDDEENTGMGVGAVTDIRSSHALTYVLLGAGTVVTAGLIALMVILLIRRRRAAGKAQPDEDISETDPDYGSGDVPDWEEDEYEDL